MSSSPENSDEPLIPPTKRRQFSIRSLFVLTTILAGFYALLHKYGILAHVAVWASFLIVGPIVGVIFGIKRLKETDAIVNGVQAGALGGLAGFVGAFVLLAPSYTAKEIETTCYVAAFGSQAAFVAGGLLGFLFGIFRSVVKILRTR